jgi:hypothetical protein
LYPHGLDCGVAPVILRQRVEHEFNPRGNPQFLENLEQIIFDSVLAEFQLLGNLAVRQGVSYQGNNFFFALRQQAASLSIDYPKRARRHQFVKNVFHLASVNPNLALMNGINTLGELFAGFRPREYSTGSRAESVNHQIVLAVFQQQNETGGKLQGLDRAQNGVPGKAAVSQHAAHNGDVWLRPDDFVRYCFGSETNR